MNFTDLWVAQVSHGSAILGELFYRSRDDAEKALRPLTEWGFGRFLRVHRIADDQGTVLFIRRIGFTQIRLVKLSRMYDNSAESHRAQRAAQQSGPLGFTPAGAA